MAVPVFMVITGYLSAMSFRKKGIQLRRLFHPIEIIHKWLRFIIPFTVTFTFQIFVKFHIGKMSIVDVIKLLLSGGDGPGGYYFPVMLQAVLIIPVILYLVTKWKLKGLMICFCGNIFFEVCKTIFDLEPYFYRLCVLRYVFILAYGVFLFVDRNEELGKRLFYIAGCIGVIYIILYNYTQATPIITNQWTNTSIFAVLYIVPIMMFLIKQTHFQNQFVELLGRSSFNIFLVQMIYYWVVAGKVCSIIELPIIQLAIHILVCCTLGVIFYKIENPMTQRLVNTWFTVYREDMP